MEVVGVFRKDEVERNQDEQRKRLRTGDEGGKGQPEKDKGRCSGKESEKVLVHCSRFFKELEPPEVKSLAC